MDDITSGQGSGPRRDYAATQGPRRDYEGPGGGRGLPMPFVNTAGPAANRQIDASPIGQALAALEESSRALLSVINRHSDRLELVLQPMPLAGNCEEKQREPVSVLDRIESANGLIRMAQGRVEALTERLLL